MRRRLCSLELGLTLLTMSSAGLGEDTSEPPAPAHEDLDLLRLLNIEVSTATKTRQSLDDAPAVITVVTREDLQSWGYQSVGEVLQHIAGFHIIDDHILPNAGVRGVTGGLGAESSVIKVMIDGRSVAFRSTSGNWLGVELIPLSAVQQIEIVRGPASALYGADAFLGVINIITLDPTELSAFDGRLAVGTTGSNFGGRFDVASGALFGDVDLLVAVAGEKADRSGLRLPSESPAPVIPGYNAGQTLATDLHRNSLSLLARAGYRLGPSGHLVWTGHASGISRGGDFAPWAQLSAGRDTEGREVGTTISLGQARLSLDGLVPLAPELFLAAQGTYFQGGTLPPDRIEVASDLFYVERTLGYQGVEANLELRWLPRDAFNVIAGVEAGHDTETLPSARRIDKDTGATLTGALRVGPSSRALVNLGAFVSSSWKLLDPYLKLTFGLRYDHHGLYGNQLTGRAGITSKWTPRLVTKALYGSAFKAPSPYLLYAVPFREGDVIGNAQLKPQYIHTSELLVSYKASQFLQASSSVAYNWLRDKAEFTPLELNQTADNIASQRGVSWATRADVTYHEDVQGYLALDLEPSTRDSQREGYQAQLVGKRNVVFPPWTVRGGVLVALPSHPKLPLELSTQAILVGPRRASDASILQAGESFELPTYVWLNASLAAPEVFLAPGHATSVALRGKNLLGSVGPDPGFSAFEYPLAPRELFIEARHVY